MSSQSIKDLVRRYYEEVVSTGDLDRVPAFISPAYVEVYDNVRHALGVEGARQHILGVRATYPDLSLEVTQQVAEGSLVVSQVTMRGTHAGEWLGMAPTGRFITVTAVNIDRVHDGRIVEHGGAANLLEPLLRIGAIRVVGPSAAAG
ncbi:MAG: ester cyclase [Gemmatimonadota bacterium]|nr:ester cyclase [Gemmatimonadota bacterium]